MSARRLNALERKLHQAALLKNDKTITPKELESLAPDSTARLSAVNFLLGTGLLVVLKGENAQILYRAVSQEELNLKKGLNDEEALVLDRIRAAGNEGIWTKHIKVKTQLHQTIVDRCLKSLTHKQLIKTVPDVRHPTRKIYMLASFQPASELTGGPWYTDKELDTEFIKLLSEVCLKIVREKTFAKARRGQGSDDRRLYPLSDAPYATSQQVLTFLQKSRVTETTLTVEDVEMLLEVLVLDGKIEKIPALHVPTSPPSDKSEEEDLHEDSSSAQALGKRKRSVESSEDDRSPSQRKRARGFKGNDGDDTHRGRRHRTSDTDVAGDEPAQKRAELEPVQGTSSDTGSEDGVQHRRASALRGGLYGAEDLHSVGVVYRAIREERIPSSDTGQAPCLRCPTFDFCKEGGPVNPQECVYYESWLATQTTVDVSA
ncbi:hypothetical protein OH77DRAFT_1516896 [Trametes cingulata]|nr:hypothetical protein OH77DRAFT_1516896 [Trametes cingulata]